MSPLTLPNFIDSYTLISWLIKEMSVYTDFLKFRHILHILLLSILNITVFRVKCNNKLHIFPRIRLIIFHLISDIIWKLYYFNQKAQNNTLKFSIPKSIEVIGDPWGNMVKCVKNIIMPRYRFRPGVTTKITLEYFL